MSRRWRECEEEREWSWCGWGRGREGSIGRRRYGDCGRRSGWESEGSREGVPSGRNLMFEDMSVVEKDSSSVS